MFCSVLSEGDVKYWIDNNMDAAYVLMNADNANKMSGRRQSEQSGEKIEVDYFIRYQVSCKNVSPLRI